MVGEPAHHGAGSLQIPAAVGIHLQLGGGPTDLLLAIEGFGHRLHQGPVMVEPIRTAEFQLDAGGR